MAFAKAQYSIPQAARSIRSASLIAKVPKSFATPQEKERELDNGETKSEKRNKV